jgi:hypothetical protein
MEKVPSSEAREDLFHCRPHLLSSEHGEDNLLCRTYKSCSNEWDFLHLSIKLASISKDGKSTSEQSKALFEYLINTFNEFYSE